MILSTSPNSGKTWVSVGICRMLANLRIRVAPFKAVAVCGEVPPGLEHTVGAASLYHHCRAARGEFHEDMNPVTILPTATGKGMLYLLGQPITEVVVHLNDTVDIGQLPADLQDRIRSTIISSYQRIQSRYDFVVIEGAGSPIDLPAQDDLANIQAAHMTNAPAILLCKVTRGGAAAAVVGTFACLPLEIRAQIKGYVLNDVTDRSFVDHVTRQAELRVDWPLLGTIPHISVWDDYSGPTKDEWYDLWGETVAHEVDFSHFGWFSEALREHHSCLP